MKAFNNLNELSDFLGSQIDKMKNIQEEYKFNNKLNEILTKNEIS